MARPRKYASAEERRVAQRVSAKRYREAHRDEERERSRKNDAARRARDPAAFAERKRVAWQKWSKNFGNLLLAWERRQRHRAFNREHNFGRGLADAIDVHDSWLEALDGEWDSVH
jgi:hypothetical protein